MKKFRFPDKDGVIEVDDKTIGGSHACNVLLNNGAVEAKAQPKPRKKATKAKKK
jgi:hypothetical protein